MRRDDGSGGDEEEREVRIIPSGNRCHGTACRGERRAVENTKSKLPKAAGGEVCEDHRPFAHPSHHPQPHQRTKKNRQTKNQPSASASPAPAKK